MDAFQMGRASTQNTDVSARHWCWCALFISRLSILWFDSGFYSTTFTFIQYTRISVSKYIMSGYTISACFCYCWQKKLFAHDLKSSLNRETVIVCNMIMSIHAIADKCASGYWLMHQINAILIISWCCQFNNSHAQMFTLLCMRTGPIAEWIQYFDFRWIFLLSLSVLCSFFFSCNLRFNLMKNGLKRRTEKKASTLMPLCAM